MTTPPRGDYAGVPLNPAGRKTADAWDPAHDEAASDQCKAYGVGGIIRMPGRLHITWQDDETLKLEADAGTQTRTLSFRAPSTQGGDWQGISLAAWDRSTSGRLHASAALTGGDDGDGPVRGKARQRRRRHGIRRSIDVPDGDSLLAASTEVVDPTQRRSPSDEHAPQKQPTSRMESDAVTAAIK